MKIINKIFIFIGALMAIGLVSCSIEAPFSAEPNEGTGRLFKSNIYLNVKGVTPITKGLSAGVPDTDDFQVEIYKKGETSSYQSFAKYGEMPEVITLPKGEYNIKVSYGGSYGNEISNAAFNSPYYIGESNNFEVEVDKIVSNIDPIVCKLQNVRVKVNFDMSLLNAMSEDSEVAVQLGKGTILYFTKDTQDDGFFEYGPGDLTATFIGMVEGIEVNETKELTASKITAGNYYIITFKLHNADASNPGNIVPGGDSEDDNGFSVDASVGFTDLNSNQNDYDTSLNPDDPNNRYIEDDMRPENGQIPDEGDNSNDDNNPDIPDTPDTPANGPVITASAGVDLNGVNNVEDLSECKLFIQCDNGIKEFEVEIESDELVASLNDLAGWNDGKLNLVNPGEKESFLNQLLGEENVGSKIQGRESMEFDITSFLEMLSVFDGNHRFVVKVTDLSGLSNNATLQLKVNN